MAEPSPPLRIAMVEAASWSLARNDVAASSGLDLEPVPEPLDEAARDAAWRDLVASGLAVGPGELDPNWQRVLASTLTAEIAFRLVSHYRDLAYVADLTLDAGVVTSLLRRLRVAPAPDGTLEPRGADPVLELAAIAGEDAWPLVRRVLPPLEELRAAPLATPEGEVEEVVLADDLRQQVRDVLAATPGLTPGQALTSLPGLPPVLKDLLRPKATVASFAMVHPAGTPAGSVGAAWGFWALGELGLYRVHLRSGDPVISRVRAGDFAYHVAWQTRGALDVVRAAGAARLGGAVR